MGSPTRDNAQCFTTIPSLKRSSLTPGTPGEHSEKQQALEGMGKQYHFYFSWLKIFNFFNGSLVIEGKFIFYIIQIIHNKGGGS